MPDAKTLIRYDEDFLAWSKEQAKALRAAPHAGSNLALDWENLAEEVEGLGTSQKLALRSRMRRIIHHLLKLQFSPLSGPQRGWRESVDDARSEIADLLETSPSLKNEGETGLELALRHGSKKAIFDLEEYGEINPAVVTSLRATTYTAEQILGDWFPPKKLG